MVVKLGLTLNPHSGLGGAFSFSGQAINYKYEMRNSGGWRRDADAAAYT